MNIESKLNLETIFIKLKEIINNAYVPYSHFRVACICLTNNKFYYGVNIENASYPVGICAERSAASSVVSDNNKTIEAVFILSDDKGFGTPCGMCRQFLSEFMDLETNYIYIFNWQGKYIKYSISELLKDCFTKNNLTNK